MALLKNMYEFTAGGATTNLNLLLTALLNIHEIYRRRRYSTTHTNTLLTALLNNRHESTADGATLTDTNLLLTALLNKTEIYC